MVTETRDSLFLRYVRAGETEMSEGGADLRDFFAAQVAGHFVASAIEHNQRLEEIWPVTMDDIAGKAFALADAMVRARGVETSDDRRVRELEKKNAELEETLETLRPVWAQGYTSDSMAAQASATALASLWRMLGVDNQTAAAEKLRYLLANEVRST